MKPKHLLGCLLALALAWLPGVAEARPEFAAASNLACSKCHVNPTGGGPRNAGGFFAGKALGLEASTQALEKKYPKFGEFVPVVGDHLQFGADLRTMWHDIDEDPDIRGDQDTNASTFYFMESALHVDAQLLPILHGVVSYDFAQNTVEAFALVDHLPAGLYVKVGRFILPFGLRLDDHTAFTRDGLGFGNLSHDTGVEVGLRPGPAFLCASFSNGNLGDRGLDRDGDHYAATAQAGVRFWKIGLGGSFFHNTREGLERRVFGPWITFGVWRLGFLAEADVANQESIDPRRPAETVYRPGSAAIAQLDLEAIRGLHFQARYAHTDPDWHVDNDFREQVMGGVLLYPIPFLSFAAQYRFNREDPPIDNNEILLQAHLYF